MSDYDPMRDQWHHRGVRGADWATNHPVRAAVAGWGAGTLAVILVVVTIAAIVLVGWRIGWWSSVANAKRQGTLENINGHVLRHSFGFQQNLRDDITKNIGNVLSIGPQITETTDAGTKAALRAQGKGILAIVCQDAAQITGDPLPPSQASFVTTNCEAGNVSPSSPYQQGTNP